MSKKKDDEKELLNAEAEAAEQEDTAAAEEEAAEEADDTAEESKPKKKEKKKTEFTSRKEADRALNRVKRLKKLKYGTLATAITLIFIAIIVAANVICNILDNRYHWNIDLTSSGLYEMDAQTVSYLKNINSDVTITVLAPESYFEQNNIMIVPETLSRFRTESNGRISVDYVDTTKHPEAANRYTKNYSGQLTLGDIVVSNKEGDLVRVLKLTTDVVKITRTPNYQTMSYDTSYSFIGEQSLLSAITGVTDLNPITIAVIDTLNGEIMYNPYETGFVAMMNLLEKNNYTVEHVDIAKDEISTSKYDFAILCAPYNDLTEAQVQKLTDFLQNGDQYGKTLIYFGSALQRESLPNVDAFLEVWGVKVERAKLLDSNRSTAQVVPVILGDQMAYEDSVPVASPTDAELNGAFTSKLPIVAPYFCPVTPLFTTNAGRTTTTLLKTADTCVKMQPDGTVDQNQQSFDLAVLSKTTFTDGSSSYESSLITFGSSFFMDYSVTSSTSSYGNADYFIQTLNSLTGKEQVITIAEKSLNPTMVTVTSSQRKTIRNVTVFIIPAIVALAGIFVYLRRKNK
ncbi:MAG: GldG family protein [Oscillospiraceae bacterium]|nr:GldG family protein [Oscillospiraceae bacterium]